MNIQSVLSYKINNYKYSSAYNFKQNFINHIYNDTFSFTGKNLDCENIGMIKEQAYIAKLDGLELLGQSFKVKKDAYAALQDAEKELSKAMDIIKIYKRDSQKASVKLRNGNHLEFSSKKKGDKFYMTATEFDSCSKPIRIVKAVNNLPFEITTIGDRTSVYKYGSGVVNIKKSSSLNKKDAISETHYEFAGCKLKTSVISRFNNDKTLSDVYFYTNDNPTAFALNSRADSGVVKCDRRYIWDDNGKIISCCDNYYQCSEDQKAGHEKCFYYKNGDFIAQTLDTTYDVETGHAVCSEAHYLTPDKQIAHSNELRFIIDETGLFISDEK